MKCTRTQKRHTHACLVWWVWGKKKKKWRKMSWWWSCVLHKWRGSSLQISTLVQQRFLSRDFDWLYVRQPLYVVLELISSNHRCLSSLQGFSTIDSVVVEVVLNDHRSLVVDCWLKRKEDKRLHRGHKLFLLSFGSYSSIGAHWFALLASSLLNFSFTLSINGYVMSQKPSRSLSNGTGSPVGVIEFSLKINGRQQ